MKTRKTSALLASAALASFMGAHALGAEQSWDGGGANDNWTTPGNWLGDTAPLPLDLLTFSGTTRLTPNNDFAAGTSFGGIGFDATAGTFTLGGNALSLVQLGHIVNNSANAQTINLPVTLLAGEHRINGGTAGLALTGGLIRGTGGVARFSGAVRATGLSNNAFGMIGPWATHGTDYAAVDGSGNVGPYTNFTEIGANPAGLADSPGVNIRWTQTPASTPGTLTLAAGVTNLNTLSTPFNNTQTIVFTPTTTLRFGAQGGILKGADPSGLGLNFGAFGTDSVGTITAGGADNQDGELFLNSAFGSITVRPVIADNGTGTVRVVSANGRLGQSATNTVSGHNTYTGGTYVLSGDLSANERDSFGTGSVEVAAGARAVTNPVSATTVADATYTNDFFIQGFGTPGSGGLFEGALRVSRLSDVTGTIHLLGDSQITFRFANATQGASISGKITGNHALTLGDSGANALFNINNSTNDWTGDTTLRIGTLRIGGTGEVIPNGPAKGNFNFTANSGTLNLNGRTETLNGLNGGGNELDLHRIVSSGAPGHLRVGDNNASGNFGPGSHIVESIGTTNFSTVSVTKIGTGEQVFAGNNTYTGVTTVEAGRLVLKNDGITNAWTPVFDNAGADIQGGSLVLDYAGSTSPAATVLGILDAGFDQTPKFSSGDLRSSAATAQLGLGWADDTTASQVIVAFTRYGDATLDGLVNLADFNRLAANFGSTTGAVWALGDFNYDGNINLADFNLLAANFGLSAGPDGPTPDDWASLGAAAVPEPAGILLATTGIAALAQRRRRSQ